MYVFSAKSAQYNNKTEWNNLWLYFYYQKEKFLFTNFSKRYGGGGGGGGHGDVLLSQSHRFTYHNLTYEVLWVT